MALRVDPWPVNGPSASFSFHMRPDPPTPRANWVVFQVEGNRQLAQLSNGRNLALSGYFRLISLIAITFGDTGGRDGIKFMPAEASVTCASG